MGVNDLPGRIAELLDSGLSLAEVERDLIERAGALDDDERAALWLFAWSYAGDTAGAGSSMSVRAR
jgi:hypothetical protein